MKFCFFLKNGKQGVQTVRLDKLNNIVTWANISFMFKNLIKFWNPVSRWDNLKMIIFDKIALSQRWKIKIQAKFYPKFSCICPICEKNICQFSIIRSPLNMPHKLTAHSSATAVFENFQYFANFDFMHKSRKNQKTRHKTSAHNASFDTKWGFFGQIFHYFWPV